KSADFHFMPEPAGTPPRESISNCSSAATDTVRGAVSRFRGSVAARHRSLPPWGSDGQTALPPARGKFHGIFRENHASRTHSPCRLALQYVPARRPHRDRG